MKNLFNKFLSSITGFYIKFILSIFSFLKKYKFQSILLLIISSSTIITIGHIDQVGWVKFFNEFENKEKPFYLVNIAIVIAAITTATFTWWKNNINQRISLTQEITRQDSLYAKAVEFLKETNDLITRQGGVHILKDLAITSPQQAQKCIDMLCSLNESWMPIFLNDYPDFFKLNKNFPNIKNREEIKLYKTEDKNDKNQFVYQNEKTKDFIDGISLSQLILQTLPGIIRHISNNPDYKGLYDLSYKYLCSINLDSVNFKKFILININLQSANLRKANLLSADLYEAILKSANLYKANLQFANLWNANLESANLNETILKSAKLWNAKLESAFLVGSNLQSANIQLANLKSADLDHSNLKYAWLNRANLQSAYLREANLKLASLKKANLKSTDFTKSSLLKTDFRNAKNIDTAKFDENKKDAIFTDEDYKRHYPEEPPPPETKP